jgi:hypothetical protein
MRNPGPEWIAAIALLIQALIFAVQAGFFYWQAKILRRHAATLEEHTNIAGAQAKTAELIGQALDQQGKVLAEQTKIMDEQFKFQHRVDARIEKGNLLNRVVEVWSCLGGLVAMLTTLQHSIPSQADQHDVTAGFSSLAGAVTELQKAVVMAIHISDAQRLYFAEFCHDLAFDSTGDPVKDLKQLDALKSKYDNATFYSKLRSLHSPSENKS